MKVFICLLATIAACNATFFSGLGGGKSVTYNVVAKPTSLGHSLGGGSIGGGSIGGGSIGGGHHGHHGHGHGHTYVQSYGLSHGLGHGYSHGSSHSYAVAPQLIKVIVEEARDLGAGANIHSYGSGSYGGGSYGGGYSYAAPQEEVFQVIHEHAPVSHSYSSGGHAGGYAVVDAGHSYGSGYVHNSLGSLGGSVGTVIGGGGGGGEALQLNSILPQILQIIEQDGVHGFSSGGSSQGHWAQLIDAFGHHGTAYVTANKKGQHSHLSNGHVIEKGVLQLNKGKLHGGAGVNLAGTGLGDLLNQLSNLNIGKGGGGSGHVSVKSGW